MKLLSVLLLVAAAVAVWLVVSEQRAYYKLHREVSIPPAAEPAAEPRSEETEYQNAELGFSFLYSPGADGFVLTEDTDRVWSEQSTYLGGVMLMESREEVLLEERVNGEGPPTITVRAYENVDMSMPFAWAESHPNESNIGLRRGDVSDFVHDGRSAIRYMVDGLYLTDTLIVTNADRVYVLSGAFMEEETPVREGFLTFLETFRLIP